MSMYKYSLRHKINFIYALFLVGASIIQAQGFIVGTLVKTPSGYCPIESLSFGDKVISYDLNNSCVECAIISVNSRVTDSLIELTVGDETILVEDDHQFYLPQRKYWAAASSLEAGDFLLKNCRELVSIDSAARVSEPVKVYDLTVEQYHNFCVTREDILAHNFLPVIVAGVVWTIGDGVAFYGAAGVGAAIISGIIYNSGAESRKQEIYRHIDDRIGKAAAGGGDRDPEDPKKGRASAANPPPGNSKKGDESNKKGKTPTQEAREKARELGYKLDKNPPFNTHGEPAYRNGQRWISRDVDAHKGGYWKMFDKYKRLGTYDKNLKIKVGN